MTDINEVHKIAVAINEHAHSWLKNLYALNIDVVLHGTVKSHACKLNNRGMNQHRQFSRIMPFRG